MHIDDSLEARLHILLSLYLGASAQMITCFSCWNLSSFSARHDFMSVPYYQPTSPGMAA